MQPFHLAFPVHNLQVARQFYGEVLGCSEGRSSDTWIDFNLYGHQIVAHLVEGYRAPEWNNPVDKHDVPVPHFGVILSMDEWHQLAKRLEKLNIGFVIRPYIRFQGQVGEQATMFFLDPSGNALEFKAFANPASLFAK